MLSRTPRRGVRLRDERGGVLILWAGLTFAVLFLFMLAIDTGNWFVHHRHLQTQVDAATLAGGAHFGDCFSPDPAIAAGANAAMKNAALVYAGEAGSAYNEQVGGGAARVNTLFNSKTFYRGDYVDGSVETQDPCQTPNLMFDVKQTEIDVPYVLANLVSAFVPGADTVVPAINARARVQLKKATIVQGSMPLAVPDVDPKYVWATFVNTADATKNSTVQLTKGAAVNGLNYWQGSGSAIVPAGANVEVRIGLGGQMGTCPAGTTGGTGFVCYDYSATDDGLAVIRGTGSLAAATAERPAARVWTSTSCVGDPFFSAELLGVGTTTCGAAVFAQMDISGGPVTSAASFTATLDGAGLTNANKTKLMSYIPASGYWTTGYAYTLPIDGGAVSVSLDFKSSVNGSKAQSYNDVQRVYSALEEDSGPVKALKLTTASAGMGAPYALNAGTHTITVDVGLEGSLDLTNQADTVMLRLTGGSRTSAVRCDGSGANAFKDAIIFGCKTPYQLNSSGFCPDPAPPAGPATCVPTEPGGDVGPTQSALDTRFASCPPINWPAYDVGTDKRVVRLMITDFSALGGSGGGDVPVTNFGGFYITGWTGSSCANNDPPPVTVKKGAIWGHFIKYIAPDPFGGGTEGCDPVALTPCIPVLVK